MMLARRGRTVTGRAQGMWRVTVNVSEERLQV